MLATLTSKAQITLPKGVRELLQLKPGDKVDFRPLPDGRITVAKGAHPRQQSFATLRGLLPTPEKSLSVEEMRQSVLSAAAARAASSKRRAA